MSYLVKSNWYEYKGKHWAVNPSRSGLRVDVLRKILAQLDDISNRHRKVFIFRFDLSVNEYTPTNELITKLIKSVSGRIRSHYGCGLVYTWVREQERAKKQHYHVVFMLNGSKVNNPHMIKEWLRMIWERYGRCSWVRYYHSERDDQVITGDVSYHISYLAKGRGKGYRPEQTKDYGGSRVSVASKQKSPIANELMYGLSFLK
ncbi:YagK/YfjJ domain-containing protein [Vibrio variabilis]|uniref:YagK/YfjJ domain-containing protein n=1 Tax=Vibrio variabilis TaxID=990271 RepID=UPI000DD769FB|nr:inovirus-type Gp2 protein [Vibrio variabilis]